MPHITKRIFGSLLLTGIVLCVGYVAAQQTSSQESRNRRSVTPQSTQATPQRQNGQLRDQLLQLQMQVKDLQTAIDDLKSAQKVIGTTAKETHELVLDCRVLQAQDRQSLNSLVRSVGQDEKQIATLGQQVGSMMLDLRRVKTKVGLY